MYLRSQWSHQVASKSETDAVKWSSTGVANNLLVYAKLKNCEKCLSLLPEPKVTSSSCSFRLAKSSKPKDPLFAIINDEEKQQIPILKTLEPANVCHFFLKIKIKNK